MPNFASIWEGIVDAVPGATAAAHGFDAHTWSEFEDRSARIAAALGAAGVGHDDKVGLYLYNGFEYEEVQFAAFKQRAVPCNVNYRYLSDELLHLLTNADAKAVFFDHSLADRIADVHDRCPDLELLVQVGGGPLLDGAVHYDDLLAQFEPAPRIERSGDDLWFLYTGGTTGHPKAVMWPHAELQKNSAAFYRPLGVGVPKTVDDAVAAAVELHRRGRTTRVLAGAPLMHGTSGIVSLQVLSCGGAVATLPSRSFDAKELWEVVAYHRLTMLAIVGEAFSRPMLEELDRAAASGVPHDLSSLFQIMSSGVMWSKESKARFLEFKQLTLLDSLGSSESPGQGQQLTRGESEATTGRFQLGETTVVIADDGRVVEPGSGEIGRLANRGIVPLGYFKDEQKTAETFPTIDGVRYSIPGDRDGRSKRHDHAAWSRLGLHQLWRGEDLPGGGRGGVEDPPRRHRLQCGRSSRRTMGSDGQRSSESRARGRCDRRRARGPRPNPDRCLQDTETNLPGRQHLARAERQA